MWLPFLHRKVETSNLWAEIRFDRFNRLTQQHLKDGVKFWVRKERSRLHSGNKLKVVIFRLVWDFGGRLFDLFLEPFLGAKKSPIANTSKPPSTSCWTISSFKNYWLCSKPQEWVHDDCTMQQVWSFSRSTEAIAAMSHASDDHNLPIGSCVIQCMSTHTSATLWHLNNLPKNQWLFWFKLHVKISANLK